MSGIVDDRRKNKTAPSLWLVATDKFMSGWGQAPDKSYIAYPVYNYGSVEYYNLLQWMEDRNDFIRVRLNMSLPRVKDGCHLSINDAPDADRG